MSAVIGLTTARPAAKRMPLPDLSHLTPLTRSRIERQWPTMAPELQRFLCSLLSLPVREQLRFANVVARTQDFSRRREART